MLVLTLGVGEMAYAGFHGKQIFGVVRLNGPDVVLGFRFDKPLLVGSFDLSGTPAALRVVESQIPRWSLFHLAKEHDLVFCEEGSDELLVIRLVDSRIANARVGVDLPRTALLHKLPVLETLQRDLKSNHPDFVDTAPAKLEMIALVQAFNPV